MNSYITQASGVNKQCWERDKQTNKQKHNFNNKKPNI